METHRKESNMKGKAYSQHNGKKNRFSILLEQLVTASDLKNYTLAKELQYDVSYISKWIGGKMLPSEKNVEEVLDVISGCVVNALTDKKRVSFYQDYHVDNQEDLKQAIYDNLIIEYNYVKEIKRSSGSEIAPKISYYPELTLLQFISKMRHPSLRKVKSLEVMAVMDILSMSHEYRLMILDIGDTQPYSEKEYPGVHFSMLLNLNTLEKDVIYDSIFLMNMLSSSDVDLQLYGSHQAAGKSIFLVKDVYAVSGMLIDSNSCMSVTVSEDERDCNILYHKVKAMCNREILLFRKMKMKPMVNQYDYMQSLLSADLRWLIGHMTEHFLPDRLFEELLKQTDIVAQWEMKEDKIHTIHNLTRGILSSGKTTMRVMFYEEALNDFVVSGRLDFFNSKVTLTMNQRLEYAEHLLQLLEQNEALEVKLVSGRFVTDFQYTSSPCLFLANTISYLRLDNKNYLNNIVILNGNEIKTLYNHFYESIWSSQKKVVICDREEVKKKFSHVVAAIRTLSIMQQETGVGLDEKNS